MKRRSKKNIYIAYLNIKDIPRILFHQRKNAAPDAPVVVLHDDYNP